MTPPAYLQGRPWIFLRLSDGEGFDGIFFAVAVYGDVPRFCVKIAPWFTTNEMIKWFHRSGFKQKNGETTKYFQIKWQDREYTVICFQYLPNMSFALVPVECDDVSLGCLLIQTSSCWFTNANSLEMLPYVRVVLNSFIRKTSSSPKKTFLSPNFRELHVFLSRYMLAKIFKKNVDVWYPQIVPGVWSLVTLHSAAAALKDLRSALRCWSLLTFIGQFWHNKSTV